MMSNLLLKEMEFHHRVEVHRRELKKCAGYNVVDLFQYITFESVISPIDLQKFLLGEGFKIESEDIDNILRRIDKDRDGVMTYTEFTNGIIPSDKNFGPMDAHFRAPPTRTVLREEIQVSKQEYVSDYVPETIGHSHSR